MGSTGTEPIRPLEELLTELGQLSSGEAEEAKFNELRLSVLHHPESNGHTLVEFMYSGKYETPEDNDGHARAFGNFLDLLYQEPWRKGLTLIDYLTVLEAMGGDSELEAYMMEYFRSLPLEQQFEECERIFAAEPLTQSQLGFLSLAIPAFNITSDSQDAVAYADFFSGENMKQLLYVSGLAAAIAIVKAFKTLCLPPKPRTVRDFKHFMQQTIGYVLIDHFIMKSDEHREFWVKLNRLGRQNIQSQPPENVPDIDATVGLSDGKWSELETEFRRLLSQI